MFLKKILKISSCLLILVAILAITIVPSFAYTYRDSVAIHNPFSIEFEQYQVGEGPVYFTYSLDRITNSYEYSDVYKSFVVGSYYTYCLESYSLINNQVYGSANIYHDATGYSGFDSEFYGLYLNQPFLFDISRYDQGSITIERNNTLLDEGKVVRYDYSLFNFDTQEFDAFTISVPLDDVVGNITTINLLNQSVYDLVGNDDYNYRGVALVGNMDITITQGVDGLRRSVSFDNINLSIATTFPDLQNRNDEYLLKILQNYTNAEVVEIGDFDFTQWLGYSVESILNAPLFGSSVFTIGNLFSIVIAIGVVVLFIKMFAGG